jgi:hypothetical protein
MPIVELLSRGPVARHRGRRAGLVEQAARRLSDPQHPSASIRKPARWSSANGCATGKTVQFHVRGCRHSRRRISKRCWRDSPPPDRPARPQAGAPVLHASGAAPTSTGRADHDTDLFRATLGDLPLGGFFCNGEIGPVAGGDTPCTVSRALSGFSVRPARARG